jgi:hypothetical protein
VSLLADSNTAPWEGNYRRNLLVPSRPSGYQQIGRCLSATPYRVYLLYLRIFLILPETAASYWGSSSKAITSVTLSLGTSHNPGPSIVVALGVSTTTSPSKTSATKSLQEKLIVDFKRATMKPHLHDEDPDVREGQDQIDDLNTTAEVLKWPRVWLLDVWILLVVMYVCGLRSGHFL